jgi:hypothetical protein
LGVGIHTGGFGERSDYNCTQVEVNKITPI